MRDGVLTRAVDVANKKAGSFSALVEKHCHRTAMSDAARLLGLPAHNRGVRFLVSVDAAPDHDLSLLAPDFVAEGGALSVEGKPGRGKTHLAIAIAYRALQNGFDALFTTAAERIDPLSAASRGERLREALGRYFNHARRRAVRPPGLDVGDHPRAQRSRRPSPLPAMRELCRSYPLAIEADELASDFHGSSRPPDIS